MLRRSLFILLPGHSNYDTIRLTAADLTVLWPRPKLGDIGKIFSAEARELTAPATFNFMPTRPQSLWDLVEQLRLTGWT